MSLRKPANQQAAALTELAFPLCQCLERLVHQALALLDLGVAIPNGDRDRDRGRRRRRDMCTCRGSGGLIGLRADDGDVGALVERRGVCTRMGCIYIKYVSIYDHE